MIKKKLTGTNLESLLDMLASKDGIIRLKARKSLVKLGKPTVSSLIQTLQNSKQDQVRRETIKTLGAIGDAESIPILVKTLEDSNADAAWAAAKALIKFKKTAWPSLLEALIKRGAESLSLRRGAHHVLLKQKMDGSSNSLVILIKTLESKTATESVPAAAYKILKFMK